MTITVTCPTGGLASPHPPGLRPSPGQAETARPPAGDQQLVPVVHLDDLPPGTMSTVEVDGRHVTLLRPNPSQPPGAGEDTLYAIEAFCTHAAGPLGEGTLTSDHCVVCPWHGATFDARNGEVLRGPARKGLRTYRALVEDGVVFIAL